MKYTPSGAIRSFSGVTRLGGDPSIPSNRSPVMTTDVGLQAVHRPYYFAKKIRFVDMSQVDVRELDDCLPRPPGRQVLNPDRDFLHLRIERVPDAIYGIYERDTKK